jgi:hypothetical protein
MRSLDSHANGFRKSRSSPCFSPAVLEATTIGPNTRERRWNHTEVRALRQSIYPVLKLGVDTEATRSGFERDRPL